MDAIHSYRARWVIPMGGPPIENGILVVQGERVVGVHRLKRADTVDLGDVAILPGLVNCHTHLEFSQLAQPLEPYLPFTQWIRQVVNYRRSTTEDISRTIQRGLQESLLGGVTLLGDIVTSVRHRPADQRVPTVVEFQEILGLTAERIAQQLDLAKSHSASIRELIFPGLSPHAPYSVHPKLFQAVIAEAHVSKVPVAMHLAETPAERELLARGTGEFRQLLEDFGLWEPELFGQRSLQEFLEPVADLDRALVIHGNYLLNDELRFLAQNPQMTLIYCPRTHAAFGHPPHPWLTLLNLGGSVALGTDSRASNPDLSLWAELQFLAEKFPQMSQLELLQLGTTAGARALGQSRNHGSLDPGKYANCVVVGPVPEEGPALHRELITSASHIQRVMCRGQWV